MMTKKVLLLIAVLSIMSISVVSAESYSSIPTDDIWVKLYGGPVSTLRAWGDGTNSVNPTGFPFSHDPGLHYFSYSYVKWSLGSIVPGDYIVTSAKLTVNQTQNAGYTKAAAEANPLEARELYTGFSEATWSYHNPSNQNPGGLFGVGDMSNYHATNQFSITIDLLAGPMDFNSYFNNSVNSNGEIALAFTTSKIADMSGNAPFKFWSKDDLGMEAYAPLLEIEYSVVPEPTSILALMAGSVGLLSKALRRKR